MTLPESTDDYAAALQEAYRRGAEAAAAMQQQMPNAVSCPNFHQLPIAAAPPPIQEPVMLVLNPLASMPPQPPSEAGRSFSLPDMASYAARAQVEEEKRKKRLARNRASARIRRLRKKNLVSVHEMTRNIMGSCIARAHNSKLYIRFRWTVMREKWVSWN
jgi:hypothetical protein